MDDGALPIGEEERAVRLAYTALSAKDRTAAELRTWLERKGIGHEPVEHAIRQLEAAGFLDDDRYARQFAADKRELSEWGSARIMRTLVGRGISSDLAADVVSERDRETELSAAIALLADVVGSPNDDRERKRAWALLVRRGYDPELAYEAVSAAGRG